MNYKKALEMNESEEGLDLHDLPLTDLLELIEEIPAWDYPLGAESVEELARRAEIDTDTYFLGDKLPCEVEDDEPHGYDYNDLYADAAEALKCNED